MTDHARSLPFFKPGSYNSPTKLDIVGKLEKDLHHVVREQTALADLLEEADTPDDIKQFAAEAQEIANDAANILAKLGQGDTTAITDAKNIVGKSGALIEEVKEFSNENQQTFSPSASSQCR